MLTATVAATSSKTQEAAIGLWRAAASRTGRNSATSCSRSARSVLAVLIQGMDHDPGIRPPTHAFWRRDDGQWFATPLSQPQQQTMVESSGFPLDNLRFGDFTGDGVTDVLANEGGHWAISDAARGGWTLLNPTLNDPLSISFSIANDKITHIYIANMDSDDNVDDVLRLDVPIVGIQGGSTTLTGSWQRSVNGTTPWNFWKSYAFTIDGDHPEDYADFGFAFVGQFEAVLVPSL